MDSSPKPPLAVVTTQWPVCCLMMISAARQRCSSNFQCSGSSSQNGMCRTPGWSVTDWFWEALRSKLLPLEREVDRLFELLFSEFQPLLVPRLSDFCRLRVNDT